MGIREYLVDWVDRDNVDPERTVHPKRVLKLFVAIMTSRLIAVVPMGLLWLGIYAYRQQEARDAMQQKIRLGTIRDRNAIRNFEQVGDATLMMYGIDPAKYRREREQHAATHGDPAEKQNPVLRSDGRESSNTDM